MKMSRRNLPFDIQMQIIERLPIKSLIQFRSVCKEWKSFIDSSHFIAAYNSFGHSQSQHLVIGYKVDDLLITDEEEETDDEEETDEEEETDDGEETDDEEETDEEEVKYVSFVDDDTFPQQKFAPTVPPLLRLLRRPRMVDSCCGLLCLTGYFGDPYEYSARTQLAVLWNPAIRKSIAVVVPDMVDRRFCSTIGFGVFPDTKDPKLVKITYICKKEEIESISCIPDQVMVFTLSSGEWTCLCSDQLPRKSIEFSCRGPTVIGQFIYWLAIDWTSDNGGFHFLIMSFDLSTDEFREIHLPDSLRHLNLFISRRLESLVLLDYNRDSTHKHVCDVWMMDHGDSKVFTKLFTINVPNASVACTVVFRKSGEPIVDTEDEENMSPTFALVVYEPCLEDVTDIRIRGYHYSVHGSSYTESLLLLDHDDGCIISC